MPLRKEFEDPRFGASPLGEPRAEGSRATASSTEVIYLLVPPTGDAPPKHGAKPWTLVERAAFAYLEFRLRSRETPLGHAVRAIGLVTGYSLMALPLLVGGYFLKSAIGFDMFPGTHMGGYLPDVEWRGR